MANDVQREADELWRYYSELGRRLAQTGVRDVPYLLGLYEQLQRALDAISRQEIQWALEQAERLIEMLVRMDSNLQALRALKVGMDRHGS
jgi:hypothetical protein